MIGLLLSSCAGDEQPEPSPAPPASTATPEAPVQEPLWDPRDVDDLPAAARGVAPGLPAVVDPPAVAPLLETKPMDAAVLSVNRRGGRIQLLGVDGSWREIQTPEKYPWESLSPDGTRAMVLLSGVMDLWDLPTGERTALPLPVGVPARDLTWVGWIDESTVLLDDDRGGWRIDIESGASERTPFPRWDSGAWLIDDDGALLEFAGLTESPRLLDWSGGSARRTDLPGISHLQRSAVRGDTVIGTMYDDRGFAVVSFDRSSPALAERLVVRDFDGNYSNWAMRSVAVLADGSALFWVAVPGRAKTDGWRLVTWTPGSEQFELVTTSDADPTWSVTFARNLLSPEQGPWDPEKVDDLPAAATDVAPLLPTVLDVPPSSPSLADHPVDAAVLTVGGADGDVHLLSVDGSWRTVPPPPRTGSVELSRDGTRLAVQSRTGVDVWDLPTGARTSLRSPPGHQPMEVVSWRWLDDQTLLLDGRWQVDARTGEARPLRGHRAQFVVDDAGGIYDYGWGSELSMVQVRGDTLAGVGWSPATESLAVTVADRVDLTPRDVLPVRDNGQTLYGNGGLSVLALLGDGTVLLRVLVYDHGKASVRLVAWDPASDELSLITRTSGVLPFWSVAYDLLG